MSDWWNEVSCKVCGLRIDQLPPTRRFTNTHREMFCTHKFGIPARDVPDWRTHDDTGKPYPGGKRHPEADK